MKKYLVFLLLPAVAILQFCSPGKKSTTTSTSTPAPTMAKTTFEADVKPIVLQKCGPCHTTGNKEHIGEYAIGKQTIDDVIERINKEPNERGFMPMKHEKLSDSLINVFVKWKADGLLEK